MAAQSARTRRGIGRVLPGAITNWASWPAPLVMTGDLVMQATDPVNLAVDPNGADRTITLPASGAFVRKHVGTANRVTVTGTGLSVTLGPGDVLAVAFVGTSWQEI